MAKRVASSEPALSFDFFITGLFTNRSEIFAPYKAIGVTVVQFREPVLAGANFELRDQFTWQRRPGFSKFCPVQLGATEIINQFDSSRNLNGQVTSFFDSTVRLASFTNTSISTILTKTTTQQGYITTIGNMTYFSDGAGADLQKWGTPNGSQLAPQLSVWGLASPTLTPDIYNLGCWLPLTDFFVGNTTLDPNGNLEQVTATLTPNSGVATPTVFSIIALAGSNPLVDWEVNPYPPPDAYLCTPTVGKYTSYLAFTGFTFSSPIPSGATILGVVVSIWKSAVITGIVDKSVKLVYGSAVIGTDHASAIPWPSPYTVFGKFTYGNAVDKWGYALTPTIVNDPGFGVAISADSVSSPYDALVGYNGNDNAPAPTITVYYTLTTGIGGSGPNEPIWATTLGGVTADGSLQWTNYGPILPWYPDTYFPTPAVVLDINGNLQLATTAANPIAIWDASTAYVIGDLVSFNGTYWSATHTSTNIAPNPNYSVATAVGSVTTTISYWVPASGPLLTGVAIPTWNAEIGGTTTDGNYTWTNIGQGSFIETVGTSYTYGFRTIYGHLTTCSPVSINTGAILGAQTSSITSFTIAGGVVTFMGMNNFVPGNTFQVIGLSSPVGLTLNNQTLVVIAANLSSTQFSANFVGPDIIQSDAGSTLNLIMTVSSEGTASPLCNATVTITASSISANIATLYAANTFVPGLYVTLSGLTEATVLNGLQLQIINVDPLGQWFQVYYVTPNQTKVADTGTAVFNAVEIYRVSDGGGIYLFAGAITNPGAGATWTYNDFTTDANLNILQIAPQNDLNDPPPGAPGSTIPTAGTITAYWNGRIWIAVGNYVYFDAGPDCINGIPEESWPPANRFQFAGPVMNLLPSADGLALNVYLADRLNQILGGPETISFYPSDALSNFGISNPNAVFKDGSILGQFTTQKQYFELIEKNKEEIGQRVADYLTDNFSPFTTYATMHRNGLDVGMFLSNGTDQILRYGPNVPAWSVPYFPVGGCGALRSVETSVGIYSLMMAPPTGGGYLLARDLSTWQDNGQNYPEAYITLGSITLSRPGGELFPLQHVVGYFDAVGTMGPGNGPSIPDVSILFNEISGESGTGFVPLPEWQNEPPIGTNSPSTTLLSLRWPINAINSSLASQYIHHLQLRIDWKPENAPNLIKAISFKSEQQI